MQCMKFMSEGVTVDILNMILTENITLPRGCAKIGAALILANKCKNFLR